MLDVSSSLFQGPCSISLPKMAYVFTVGVSMCSGLLQLSLKASMNPTLCGACPATKAAGHAQLLTACVSESLLLLALDAGVCCPCLCSFLLQGVAKKVFNQTGFLLTSGHAFKHSFPCLWQLHLLCPTSGEEDTSLCYEISTWASTPPSAPRLFYQFFRTRLTRGMHLPCCFPSLSHVLIILHFHVLSLSFCRRMFFGQLGPNGQTWLKRPKGFGLMCICSMLTSWKGKQWRQAFLCSVQMTAAAFHLVCESPVFTRQPWCQEHLMAHRQVYLPSVSLTSRNQLSDCLGTSCGHENQYQCPRTSVFSSWAAPGSS